MSDQEIGRALEGLEGWSRRDKEIVREFQFRDFVEALGFIARVGLLAERADHHPTLTNTYNRVEVALWSHDSDGVTERDVALAGEVNERAG
ncbi:MAG: 4a-hydroxytetrahydrobiopterin dehydratase [Dehalococcoidia bacterium]|nr:4a-hydroxytetrahydrobiopterin dehydratase [Dehalococcoidia bacterium]